MDTAKHLIISVILLLGMIILGSMGYMVIEGWNALDSFFMTVITLTTVGYSEGPGLTVAGRLYTIFLIVVGVGFCLYVVGALVQFMVEGRIREILGRRRLKREINHLRNHYIVCGYGRIGQVICDRLSEKPFDIVVVENNPDLIPIIEDHQLLYVNGEAGDESTLLKAGIEKARGIVALLPTDADNVFLVLTARQLNPNLMIIARAEDKKSASKLLAAGANRVELPYEIGATSIAQRILRPTVTNFLDLAFTNSRQDIKMEEIPIAENSPLADIILRDSGIRQKYNLIIIAIKKSDGGMIFNPSFETKLKAGDTVIAVGEGDNLLKLEDVLNPE